MTKQWDMYEATIKSLYAENTLSVVRQIMIDQYGFKASVRAYRGRLIRWGVRKYNCRRRASSDSGGSANDGSFTSGSESTSTSMMTNNVATTFPQSSSGHLAMPRQLFQQPMYNPVDDHQARMYHPLKSYDTKPKPILSQPQTQVSGGNDSNNNMSYTWDTAPQPPPPHSKRPSDSSHSTSQDFDNLTPHNNHHNHGHNSGNSSSAEVMAPPTYFGGYGTPVPVPNMAAMGHTNHHHHHNPMSHMEHSGNNDNDNGNNGGNNNSNNNNPYASMSNAEYYDTGISGAAWETTTTGRHTTTRR
ncbi:uncharacterized protein F4807DRAFT_279427 [Annulohypoxylon truncatum]|uniref:uncharacterized protein n=1 Tax=Annulohypoxylon truncatum TaxID=327061 RepID=UPI002008D3AA|nr:uncharacterized protein F4807DRAFT_279427 [Annulohypoxylon truncatum]KAI1205474.1 hypothetical protein F4807DRAFT_279427 [Annulohypoxylon truncatum]